MLFYVCVSQTLSLSLLDVFLKRTVELLIQLSWARTGETEVLAHDRVLIILTEDRLLFLITTVIDEFYVISFYLKKYRFSGFLIRLCFHGIVNTPRHPSPPHTHIQK